MTCGGSWLHLLLWPFSINVEASDLVCHLLIGPDLSRAHFHRIMEGSLVTVMPLLTFWAHIVGRACPQVFIHKLSLELVWNILLRDAEATILTKRVFWRGVGEGGNGGKVMPKCCFSWTQGYWEVPSGQREWHEGPINALWMGHHKGQDKRQLMNSTMKRAGTLMFVCRVTIAFHCLPRAYQNTLGAYASSGKQIQVENASRFPACSSRCSAAP